MEVLVQFPIQTTSRKYGGKFIYSVKIKRHTTIIILFYPGSISPTDSQFNANYQSANWITLSSVLVVPFSCSVVSSPPFSYRHPSPHQLRYVFVLHSTRSSQNRIRMAGRTATAAATENTQLESHLRFRSTSNSPIFLLVLFSVCVFRISLPEIHFQSPFPNDPCN